MEVDWKNGLQFSTPDGDNKIAIGGRLQVDYGFFSEEDGVDDEQDGVEMRRARLGASGVIGGNVEFKTEYDFAGANVVFKDAWVGLKDAGFLGRLHIGHQKAPMGLETLTSSKFISFLERSFTSALTPSRNTGILSSHLLGKENHGTFSIGYFKDAAAPVDFYAVGSYISGATPVDFTGDLKEIEGQPVAKGQARQAHDGGVDPLADPDDDPVPEEEEQEEIPEFASLRATAEDGVASKAASGGPDQRRDDHDSPRLAGLTRRNQAGGIFLRGEHRGRHRHELEERPSIVGAGRTCPTALAQVPFFRTLVTGN